MNALNATGASDTVTALKVTVLIAAYNCEATVEAAIRSALRQSLDRRAYEVVVVNDGSVDRTGAVAGAFGPAVRVIDVPHGGLAAACNAGLSAARGDYVVRLDADDALDPDCLVILARVLDANPSIGAVYADRVETFPDGRVERVELEPFDLLRMIACGTMFRTAVVRETGGYDDLLFEEYDFLIRYLERAPRMFHVPVPLYTYTRHEAGLTGQPGYWREGWRQLAAKWGVERLQALGCDERRLP